MVHGRFWRKHNWRMKEHALTSTRIGHVEPSKELENYHNLKFQNCISYLEL